jgi:hypothetical protein
MSGGSGVLVDTGGGTDSLVITNAHVVAMARPGARVQIHMTDDRILDGRVIAVDGQADLAAIRIVKNGSGEVGGFSCAQIYNTQTLRACKLADSSRCRPGEWVIAIGSPFVFLYGDVLEGVVVFVLPIVVFLLCVFLISNTSTLIELCYCGYNFKRTPKVTRTGRALTDRIHSNRCCHQPGQQRRPAGEFGVFVNLF